MCNFNYVFFNNDTTKIIYSGDTCVYLCSKAYLINDTIFNIRKYKYDLINSVDEESSIFTFKNNVLSDKSEAWFYEFYFYNIASQNLLDELLADTTNFYWGNLYSIKELED